MSKRASTCLAAVATAAVLAAIAAGAATASTAISASVAKQRVVTIAMHDPGCHAFAVAGKFKTRLVVERKTVFRNLDEAPLVFAGKNYRQKLAVGKTLAIARAGTYHITMVGQASDDNHLLLVVK